MRINDIPVAYCKDLILSNWTMRKSFLGFFLFTKKTGIFSILF